MTKTFDISSIRPGDVGEDFLWQSSNQPLKPIGENAAAANGNGGNTIVQVCLGTNGKIAGLPLRETPTTLTVKSVAKWKAT